MSVKIDDVELVENIKNEKATGSAVSITILLENYYTIKL